MANTEPTERYKFKLFKMKLFCVLALAIPLLAQGQGNDNSEDESRVIAMEKAWNQAYKARDGKALGTILHDSLLLVSDDGSLQSKGLFLTAIDTAKPSTNQQENPESIKVRIFGHVAIATGVFRQTGFENGKAFVRRYRFLDTWIRHDNSWQCVAASATPILR
jgi:ketosteroid isomerase-like protein